MSVNEAYLEARVLSAKPEHLHLMVVDGALKFARQAILAQDRQDWGAAHNALNRSRDCVNELLVGLNPEHMPEVAKSLQGLFVFVYQSLSKADLLRDPQLIRDAIRPLEIHRQTWQEVVELRNKESL